MYYLQPGVGALEALRKPMLVPKVSYDRAQGNLAFQPMADRINPAHKAVWFRTKAGLDVPYWTQPEYVTRAKADPLSMKSDLLYMPYWMTNKSRARLIQRPVLAIKPKSDVLYHMGTDDFDGLGKGGVFKSIAKPFKKVGKIVVKALPDIATGGLYSVAKAGINVAKGKQSILGGLKSAIVRQGPAGALLTAAVGENKSLAIQGAVAGGALTAAGLSTAAGLTGMATKALSTPPPAPALPPQPVDPYAYSSEQLMPPFYQGAPGYTYPAGGPGVAEAGMFGGLSPMMIGLLVGVPLLFTLINRPAERR